MGWGGSRSGAGRPKTGEPSSRQAKTRAVKALMEQHDYSPIEAMITVAKDKSQDMNLRVSCHKELARYVAPQLKAVDIQHAGDHSITVELVQFTPDKEVLEKADGKDTDS